MYSIDFVTSEKRAHGHRWSYRQRRCARGRLVEYSNQRLERPWAVMPVMGRPWGPTPELGARRRGQRLRPRAARVSRASCLQKGRTPRDRADLTLIRASGFDPVKVGRTETAGRIETPGGDLHQTGLDGRLLTIDEARAAL
jgi:hypothetical protein